MTTRNGLFTLAALIGSSTASFAAVTLPSWYGGPNTTSQLFMFTSDDLTPAPETSSNPYGTASGVVELGFFGNGWENPAAPISNAGHDDDGAWDVGPGFNGSPDGFLSFSVPVAPGGLGPGETYRIDIMVYAVAYQDLQKIPVISILGLGSGDIVLENQGTLSTQAPAGSWQYRTWTGTLEDFTGGSIQVTLAPPTGQISVLDRVEIYTQFTIVPEPSVPLLVLLPGLAWCIRRRRH